MYGDCHSEMVEFKRDVLNDTNQLTRKAEDLKNLKPISKTFDKVIKTLNKLVLTLHSSFVNLLTCNVHSPVL